ncbi:MAG TPA: acyl-CoA dehydrogenase family protein [Actinophytocola sp.]|jgi:butyryl-CoA dehydrogenase|nr:acyl-CoA dehydrogenase family protein [Actinophytocola sp.]
MDFSLNPEQAALRELAASVGGRIYAPSTLAWDRERTVLPDAERTRLAELGFLGIALPTSVGGSGGTLLDALLVIEELAKHNQVAAFQVFEANTGPARVIQLFGTPEQQERFLRPVVDGAATMAVAISEADAGSAATDMRTTARLDGDHYVVNGTKRWCSGAGHAERYLVYVRLSGAPGAGGVGAIVVDRDTPGLSFGPQEELLGFHGIPSADMAFDDVRVPAENLVLPAGGFKRLFSAFSIERLGNATMSLAIGQACVDRVAHYVEERTQFGRPIVEFQMVQQQLADMIVQVEAARLLIWRAAAGAGTGVPDPLEASIAKCFANEMAKKVSDIAIQLHGGYGYHPEYHVERHHRDAIGWALAGGTPAMQRIRIVSQYLKRPFSQRAAR